MIHKHILQFFTSARARFIVQVILTFQVIAVSFLMIFLPSAIHPDKDNNIYADGLILLVLVIGRWFTISDDRNRENKKKVYKHIVNELINYTRADIENDVKSLERKAIEEAEGNVNRLNGVNGMSEMSEINIKNKKDKLVEGGPTTIVKRWVKKKGQSAIKKILDKGHHYDYDDQPGIIREIYGKSLFIIQFFITLITIYISAVMILVPSLMNPDDQNIMESPGLLLIVLLVGRWFDSPRIINRYRMRQKYTALFNILGQKYLDSNTVNGMKKRFI